MTTDPNQTFVQMNQVALSWLQGRDPMQIARNANAVYDAQTQCFHLQSMGTELKISYPDYEITPPVSQWHRLLILHYLNLADGHPLAGTEISFSQMKDGMIRGSGIDRKVETAISNAHHLDEKEFARICTAMGGVQIPSNADIAFRIPLLPSFPVIAKLWLADEEFPASGRLMLDASADHYLTIEDAVTAAEILIEKIALPKQKHSFAVQ